MGRGWISLKCVTLGFGAMLALPHGGTGASGVANGLPPMMRLGHASPVEPVERSDAPRRASKRDCRSWRRTADRLGETRAGALLRQTLVARACALESVDSDDGVWAWPWRDRGVEGALPPRERSVNEAWSIRCGAAGRRERCAMVHSGQLKPAGWSDGPALGFSTHFVIDTVAGQERLVWRVFVHRADAVATGEITEPASRAGGGIEIDGLESKIRLREPFDDCRSGGCLMEAELGAGSAVATELWGGRSLELSVTWPAGARGTVTVKGTIDAAGLRRSLTELSALKGREYNTLAERLERRQKD